MDHWKAAKRVMRYLKKTRDYMLTYGKSDRLEIIRYSVSDFGGCQDTRRSILGYEFITCHEASNHGKWLRNFVTGLRVVERLFCDNNSAVIYSNNNINSIKSKHTDTEFMVVI